MLAKVFVAVWIIKLLLKIVLIQIATESVIIYCAGFIPDSARRDAAIRLCLPYWLSIKLIMRIGFVKELVSSSLFGLIFIVRTKVGSEFELRLKW